MHFQKQAFHDFQKDPAQLSDTELHSTLLTISSEEKKYGILLIRHLGEVEKRRLYAHHNNCQSTWEYAVKVLGYSGSSASDNSPMTGELHAEGRPKGGAQDVRHEKVAAMNLTFRIEEAKAKIESGELDVTNAAHLERHLKKQAKEEEKRREHQETDFDINLQFDCKSPGAEGNPENAPPAASASSRKPKKSDLELLALAASQSKLDFDATLRYASCSASLLRRLGKLGSCLALAKENPASIRKENTRNIDGENLEVRITLTPELQKILTRIRELKGHLSIAEILELTAKAYLESRDPLEQAKRAQKKKDKKRVGIEKIQKKEKHAESSGKKSEDGEALREVQPHSSPVCPEKVTPRCNANTHESRTIPAPIRHEALLRSGGQCEFVDPKTQERCQCRTHLQFEHLKPFALWGSSNDALNIACLCFVHKARHEPSFPSLLRRLAEQDA